MSEQFIIKHRGGSFLGHGDTWNSDRTCAVRFDSREQAEEVAKKITSFVTVEPYIVPGHGFGGTLETVA